MTIWTRIKGLLVDPRKVEATAAWAQIERDSEVCRRGESLMSALIEEHREVVAKGKRADDYLVGLSPEHPAWEFVRLIARHAGLAGCVPRLVGFPIVQDAELHGETYRLVRVS